MMQIIYLSSKYKSNMLHFLILFIINYLVNNVKTSIMFEYSPYYTVGKSIDIILPQHFLNDMTSQLHINMALSE